MRFLILLKACGVIPIYEAIYFKGICFNNFGLSENKSKYRSSAVLFNNESSLLFETTRNVKFKFTFIL